MCGLAGWTGASPDVTDQLSGALATLHRRGPDDRGEWKDPEGRAYLGHVRLSIIDTSDAGHQPMISHNGRFVMVFNGEIYNFRELREELELAGDTFRGHSDSEVLLALFARDGPECFRRLNGIFAAAFWDRSSQALWLVRDPIGVKPLYVAEGSGWLAFASECKALVRSGAVKARLNPKAVLLHLGYLWSPGATTIFEGIRKLLPGCAMEVRDGRIVREWCYRDVEYVEAVEWGDSDRAAAGVAAAVQTAVRRQMISDVPLGAFLSGGLDSSAVAAFAQRELGDSGRLQCFTIEVSDDSIAAEGFADDLPYARRVAEHLGVDLHVVRVGGELMDRLPDMVYLLDEPTADPAALNALVISELARGYGMKVLLSGAGGDDIFTGYRRHFALNQERWWSWWPQPVRDALARLCSVLPVGHPLGRRLGRAFRNAGLDDGHRLAGYFLWLEPDRAIRLLSPELRALLSSESLYEPLLETLGHLPADAAPLNKMLYLELKHFLADHNLHYTDKMGMAAGVEVRVPLLDLDLVDLAASLPVSFKQRGAIGKWIFKRAMEPYLPRDVIYRPKSGFGVPLRRWLHGRLRGLVDETLSQHSIRARGIFDATAVEQLVREDRAGAVDASYTIFSLVCLELWCRQYLDGDFALDANI